VVKYLALKTTITYAGKVASELKFQVPKVNVSLSAVVAVSHDGEVGSLHRLK
jgi:hypothetical protein